MDRAVARIIAPESGGRVLAVAEAKIIEADPALHDERVEAERRRRYVSSSRTDEYGLRTVIARSRPATRCGSTRPWPGSPRSSRRRYPESPPTSSGSIAFGWLARPAELLQLLLEHRDEQETLDLELASPRAGVPAATAFPADLLDALREVDLTPLAPKTVLYVHLHEAAVTAPRVCPGRGPRSAHLTGLQPLLARTALTVKPVSTCPTGSGPPPTSTPSHSRNAST